MDFSKSLKVSHIPYKNHSPEKIVRQFPLSNMERKAEKTTTNECKAQVRSKNFAHNRRLRLFVALLDLQDECHSRSNYSQYKYLISPTAIESHKVMNSSEKDIKKITSLCEGELHERFRKLKSIADIIA